MLGVEVSHNGCLVSISCGVVFTWLFIFHSKVLWGTVEEEEPIGVNADPFVQGQGAHEEGRGQW